MSWRDAMNNDIKRYFGLPENASIVETKPESRWTGGCETCAFETFYITVAYATPGEPARTVEFYGDMADFMNAVEVYSNENPVEADKT